MTDLNSQLFKAFTNNDLLKAQDLIKQDADVDDSMYELMLISAYKKDLKLISLLRKNTKKQYPFFDY